MQIHAYFLGSRISSAFLSMKWTDSIYKNNDYMKFIPFTVKFLIIFFFIEKYRHGKNEIKIIHV